MVSNHLLTGMILQVPPISRGGDFFRTPGCSGIFRQEGASPEGFTDQIVDSSLKKRIMANQPTYPPQK